MQPTNYAYVRGQVLPLAQATLHISDLSIQRGYGVFDYFRVFGNTPVFLDDYLQRFHASAAALHLQLPISDEELRAVIEEVIDKNSMPRSGMKMILTGGYSANGYEPADPSLVILQQPLTLPGLELVEKGIKIITHEYVRELPQAKTINYTMGIRLIEEIKSRGASDVLYRQNGVVSEFPRCNLFMVREDDTVVTPAENVLLGVTRRNVLELAGRKYKTEEGTVPLDDLYRAKEVFLTSTTKRILPIVQVDGQVIGTGKPGEVTRTLLADLVKLEEEMVQSTYKV
ncbi:aminotransferase class IV [Pontibacter mangrovi]|uniref:branched-chain-amino-acid transaminase n=1 Tax=Pontibacter mangrovi TaxID=2589816 RepID=A0A501W4E4_9BACT|nr:aminotransferase class IV [Pontibacter mangrovi]TPE42994.1 amino acid aminotransferase [Pontibacter mangrovi]